MALQLNPSEQQDKMQVQKKFGKRLAEIRNKKNITQEKFAFEIGVDRTYISYIERGERNPSLYVLWKMAKHLKVSLSELTDLG
ncbi:MAG: MunI regulatory protein [Microgenomates group bacterium Gr01-1014_7]|nr:MAG: MunI regulatory protein [Microgenomates group bacterium Gr01-1014_7]